MTRRLLAASLLSLIGCADHRDARAANPTPAALVATSAPARPELAAVGEPPAPGRAPAAPSPAKGSLLHASDAAASPAGGALAFAVEGCAAVKGEEAGRRFPVPPPSRALPSEVTVRPSAGGVTVRHDVHHACCLTASVGSSRGEGATVIVTERLTGPPCRCRCASTLTTKVPLPKGRWAIVLDLDTNGAVRRVGTYEATVREETRRGAR